MASRNRAYPLPRKAAPRPVVLEKAASKAAILQPAGKVKEPGFISYIVSRPENRKYLLLALSVNLVFLLIYKYLAQCYYFNLIFERLNMTNSE